MKYHNKWRLFHPHHSESSGSAQPNTSQCSAINYSIGGNDNRNMELSDHSQNRYQYQLRGGIEFLLHVGESRFADQVRKHQHIQMSQEKVRLGKRSTSSAEYESIRRVVGCCFQGHATIRSILASPFGKEVPMKKRRLQCQLQIEEEVGDSDDPTRNFKIVIPEVYYIYTTDTTGEVICKMTENINCTPDCQSETPDLNFHGLLNYEITSKPAVAKSTRRPRNRTLRNPQPDNHKEPERKIGNEHQKGILNGVQDQSSSVYNSEKCRMGGAKNVRNKI